VSPDLNYTFVNTSQALKDFFVTLRATLPSGCYGDSTRVIRVSPIPSSAFDIDTVRYDCQQVVLKLEAVQKGLQQYKWTIVSNNVILLNSVTLGDTFDYTIGRSMSTDQNVQITLVTTNLANCQSELSSQSMIVRRADVINASFTATPVSQKFPNATITINNTTNPGPWRYHWDFGDGITSESSASSVTHTFARTGTYIVTLHVSNFDCTETSTSTVYIAPATPILEFDYDPASGCLPLTVNFTNRSKYADPASYAWQFGMDQGSSRAVNPSYTYYEPGSYTVTLSARSEDGENVQITKQFIIEVFEKPSAQFNVKPRQIQFPGGKLYTDNQSFGATSFLWNFGDGNTSEDFEPDHVYKTEGVFDVILVAFNGQGCSDTTRLNAGVQTIRSGNLLVPNAFSPNLSGSGNSQGQNDVFRPVIRGVIEFQMMVFNRWGELLYETKDPDRGWDGYYQGRLCQQDVYVYKIVAKSSSGETITRVGDIHLIR
jgi:gliding motility-associated-like protein